MRQPLTIRDALAFANSLLDGSELQDDLVNYHITCGRKVESIGQVGYTWWKGFLRRNPGLRVSQPVPFPNRRVTWCTWDNFKLM